MGEARRRQMAKTAGLPPGFVIPPETPTYLLVEIAFRQETYQSILIMMQEYNEAIARAGKEQVPDFATFLGKLIIPRGLTSFETALAEFIRGQRMISLPGHDVTLPRVV